MKIPTYLLVDREASQLINKLREQAVEHEVICRQAPIIWDGNNNADTRMAMDGCLGITNGTKCPIIDLCKEAAVAADVTAGVWGGVTFREIKKIRRQRESTS